VGRDGEGGGGLLLIGGGCFQGAGQQNTVESAVRLRVLVAVVGGQAQADERLQVGVVSPGRGPRDRAARLCREGGQVSREQGGAAGLQQRLLQHALQLPDVARPGVSPQARQGLGGDVLHFPPQLAAEAPHVVPRQQRQVVALPLAQGGRWMVKTLSR